MLRQPLEQGLEGMERGMEVNGSAGQSLQPLFYPAGTEDEIRKHRGEPRWDNPAYVGLVKREAGHLDVTEVRRPTNEVKPDEFEY